MELQKIKVGKIGNRKFLFAGGETIEIQDYKISSSTQGGAELEVKILVSSPISEEFELAAKKESFQPPNLTATNAAP